MSQVTPATAIPQQEERLWNMSFILLCASALFFWSSLFGSNAILPTYMRENGFREGLIGVTIGSAALASVLVRFMSGWAIDRFGGRWFIAGGALTMGLSTALLAVSHSLPLYLTARIVQGAGLALFMNGSLGQVAYVAPASKRGAAVAWWGVANNLANGFGTSIASAITTVAGYAPGFLVAGGMGIVAALFGSVVKGAAAAPAPAAPAAKRKYLTASAVLPGLVGGALGYAGGAFVVFAPLRAADLGIGNVGIYFGIYGGAMLLARLLFGPLSDKKGRGWAVYPGMALVVLSMALIGFIDHPVVALSIPLLFGLGLGGAMPGLIAWTVDRAGNSERATAVSTFYIVYDLFVFVGADLMGQMLERGGVLSYLVTAVLVSVAMVVYRLAARATPAAGSAA